MDEPDGLSAATSGEGGGRALISGYLSQKQAGSGYMEWTRRFYTLTEHVLFYGDFEGGDPVGAVLIKPDLKLAMQTDGDGSDCLVLSSPGMKPVYLIGMIPEDTRAWRAHLEQQIKNAHGTVHSMLNVRYGSGTWHEWFCVLRKNGIDCHQSPLHHATGSIPVTAQCDIDWDDASSTFYLARSVGQGVKKGIFIKSDDQATYLRWRRYLTRRLAELKGPSNGPSSPLVDQPVSVDAKPSAEMFLAEQPPVEQPSAHRPSDDRPSDDRPSDDRDLVAASADTVALPGSNSPSGLSLDCSLSPPRAERQAIIMQPPSAGEVVREGELETRPAEGGDMWAGHYFVLTPSALLQYAHASADRSRPVDAYGFSVNCTVFDTNLKASSFQLVASGKVLHAQGLSKEDTAGWIGAIRQCISSCRLDPNDALCRAALGREDDVYEVEFREKRPLGIVLERAGDWALIKMTQAKDSKIEAGSALCSINGQSVVLQDYATTTAMLAGWQPPLTLGFRRSPSMSGWLSKYSRAKRAKQGSWKTRFFRLSGGHLQFFDSADDDAETKGDVKLMGCSLTLLPESELHQPFCFRLTSGLTVLTMQASDGDDMMHWAAPLYEAVAIANGGGYLLVKERKRLAQEPFFDTESVSPTGATTPPRPTGRAMVKHEVELEGPAYGGATVTVKGSEGASGPQSAPQEATTPDKADKPEDVEPDKADKPQDVEPDKADKPQDVEPDKADKPQDVGLEGDKEAISPPAEELAGVLLAADVVEPPPSPPPPMAKVQLPPSPPLVPQGGGGGGAAAGREDTQEMEDSVSPSVSPKKKRSERDRPPPNSLMAVMSETHSGRSMGPLTDAQIEKVFDSLNLSGGGASRTMRPVNFSMFVRLVTGRQNLFFEMDTFHKHFDSDNNGFVDLEEFKAGVHRLEEKDRQHCVIVGLRAFVAETLMSI